MDKKPSEDKQSKSDNRILRHEPKESNEGDGLVMGDDTIIEAVSEHIETHLGDYEIVIHEIFSTDVHIDVSYRESHRRTSFL